MPARIGLALLGHGVALSRTMAGASPTPALTAARYAAPGSTSTAAGRARGIGDPSTGATTVPVRSPSGDHHGTVRVRTTSRALRPATGVRRACRPGGP